MLTAKNGNN